LDESVREALAGLHRFSPKVGFLGSYPRADKIQTTPSGNNSNIKYEESLRWVQEISNSKAGKKD
jgi:prephenate dehydratase